MNFRIIRSFHSKRIPNFDGYWNLILNNALKTPTLLPEKDNPLSLLNQTRIPIPITPYIEDLVPVEEPKTKIKSIVYLNGEPLQLPEKPDPPDNCCMSGCAHCVWDMYQEDMEEYVQKKSDLRDKFKAKRAPIPKELTGSIKDAAEEMDPTMRAFIEMEKKLKNS